MTAVSTTAVVQRVAQALESERRLRSIALTTRSSVADATCAGDETLLANTLITLLLITFAAVDGVQNARVMLSVNVNDAGEIGLAVSQDHVAAPAPWTTRAGSYDRRRCEPGRGGDRAQRGTPARPRMARPVRRRLRRALDHPDDLAADAAAGGSGPFLTEDPGSA